MCGAAGAPKQCEAGRPRQSGGRWSEQETSTLIEGVRCYGKGKWKRIFEDGRSVFQNRTPARAWPRT